MLLALICPHAIAQTNNSDELFYRRFNSNHAPPTPETNELRKETAVFFTNYLDKLFRARDIKKDFYSTQIKELDGIYERHKSEKTEDLALILKMKKSIYVNNLHQPEKAVEVVKQLLAELPETQIAKEESVDIEYLLPILQGRELRNSLSYGEPFPDFAEKDLDGHPISVHALKGKVVMLDFWDMKIGHYGGMELPSLLARYHQYHDQGFEIIGINMDTDEASVRDYIKTNGMIWPQYFDGKGKYNKIALKYGIYFASDDFLIDADGNYIGGLFYSKLYDQKVKEALARKDWPR